MENRRKRVEQEFDAYYSSYDPDTERLLGLLEEKVWNTQTEYSYTQKVLMHEILCQECQVHLFKESSFFFEISSGRERFTWGGLQSPVGCFFHNKTAELWRTPYCKKLEKDREEGYLQGWDNPVGIDHHCPNYDVILTKGLNGIILEAQQKLEEVTNRLERKELEKEEGKRKKAFYESVIRSNQALIGLQHRFEEEAVRLAGLAQTQEEKAHFEKIAAAAARVPAEPAQTFYEGMCAILFYRECASSVEGLGISTFALIDRMLDPYYQADLAAGRITREEARELLCDLLLYTDTRFNLHKEFHETSTTIEIGGCDRDGNVVYNEVTRMLLEAVLAVRSVNTKINCRISSAHPREYLEKIAEIQLADLPTVMMHNDDVIIPARVKYGQDIEDARLYVGCGCHEVVLAGSEVCTRADTWINLPRIFLNTMSNHADCSDFSELYNSYISDVKAYHEYIAAAKNEGEQHWCEYNPFPLYSSTFPTSLEKGRDVTEGGAKYNTTMLSMLGTATLIDSLYAVKKLVFEEKRLTLADFNRIVENDFEGQEALRQYIITHLPKHGSNAEELNEFSAGVLHDLSLVSGQTNARGGKYMPAFYPHDIFRALGDKTKATPDGRRAYTPLSRGVSPSEFVQIDSPLALINSLEDIDFTEYADSFCAEITLPQLPEGTGKDILIAIMQGFLEKKGSSLQFNLLNRDILMEAQKNPEMHKNVIVRVCGYSALFTTLSEPVQNEVIQRACR